MVLLKAGAVAGGCGWLVLCLLFLLLFGLCLIFSLSKCRGISLFP